MNKTVPIVLLVILFAAAAWYSITREPDPVHELLPPPPAPVSAVKTPPPEALPDTVAEFIESQPLPEPLPLLNGSDPEVMSALAELSGSEMLAHYLVKAHVISRFTATVDSLTSRQVAAEINPIRPAEGKFIASDVGDRVIMSTENFARYDGYINLLKTLDSDALVGLYQRYYPLLQQAWEENGGEGAFNTRLLEVIRHLQQAPVLPEQVYLVKPEAVYLFEDPQLEALGAGQKLLVRMGPANAAAIRAKLAEIESGIAAL